MRLGIDFGTCFSSAALTLANGSLMRVKDPRKHGYSFPSSVYVEPDESFLIGYSAEFKRNINPQRYCKEFKRNLGSPTPYQLGERQLMPEQLIAEVLGKLRAEANKIVKAYGCETLRSCVITVPATYQRFKNKLMQEAAENAGFEDAQLLSEPVAAAIYSTQKYNIEDGETILVYDLGGGTFDSTLIQKLGPTDYKVLGIPVGDSHCGGIDFDREVYIDFNKNCSESFRELLKSQHHTKEAYIARSIVAEHCCDIKHQLSEDDDAEIQAILMGTVEYYKLSRKIFNNLIEPYINRTIQLCDRLIINANLSWEKVDRILMVGGSCRIPYVQQILKEKFQQPIYLLDEPDLAVCLGAAIYAKKLDDQKSKHKSEFINADSRVNGQPNKSFVSSKEPAKLDEKTQPEKKQPLTIQPENIFPDNIEEQKEDFYREGLRDIKLGNYKTAVNSFSQIISKDENNIKALLCRGFATFCLGDDVEAIKHFDKVIQINKNISDAYVCRGLTSLKTNQYKLAFKDFNQAVKIDSNKGGLLGRSVSYTFMNKHRLAIIDYQHLQYIDDNFDSNAYNQAITKAYRGDFQAILEYLKEAYQIWFT